MLHAHVRINLGLAIFMTLLVGFVDAPLNEVDLGRVLTCILTGIGSFCMLV